VKILFLSFVFVLGISSSYADSCFDSDNEDKITSDCPIERGYYKGDYYFSQAHDVRCVIRCNQKYIRVLTNYCASYFNFDSANNSWKVAHHDQSCRPKNFKVNSRKQFGIEWAQGYDWSIYNKEPASLDSTAEFFPVYKDKHGYEWSQRFYATNGCVESGGRENLSRCTMSPDGTVLLADSHAAQICEWISDVPGESRLPTKDELEILVKEFDHVVGEKAVKLTERGLIQFRKAFPKNQASIWSSAVHPKFPNIGFVLETWIRGEFSSHSRASAQEVRCIRKSKRR
jgi:hypothetical protein